jgi:putative flippase GtrA
MTTATLIARYILFAVLATIANLGVQRGVLAIRPDDIGYLLALCAGTLVGLAVKYWLDKRWIFFDARTGWEMHGRLFVLYSLMGVLTTLIFWGTETAFWLIWRSDDMRELGALLGLTVGYVLKYQLDYRFVFTDR